MHRMWMVRGGLPAMGLTIGLGGLTIGLGACARGDGDTPTLTAFDPSNPAGTAGSTSGGTSPATTDITSADSTSAPPVGGCCEVSAEPGCSNPQVESCVCTIDTSCCQQQWGPGCVDLAAMSCNDPTCESSGTGPGTGPDPGTTDETGQPPPMVTCDELAAQQGWMLVRCEVNGGTQCNGMGTPTTDCDFCCEYCGDQGDVSCGDLAAMQGWAAANCEWNGNGACNGMGTPTCDCNVCCEVN